MRLHLHRRGDTADLAHLQAELDHERAHSADLARQLAELRESFRAVVDGRDHWRGVARRWSAEVVNLKAEMRRAAS